MKMIKNLIVVILVLNLMIANQNDVIFSNFQSNVFFVSTYRCGKASELHLLAVHDVTRIRIFPFGRHGCIFLGVNKHIKRTWLIQQWEESYTSCDLSNNSLDFSMNFFQRFPADFCVSIGHCILSITFFQSHIELPTLQSFTRVDTTNDNYKPLYITA